MAKNPYGAGAPLNEFTVDHPGTLIGTAGPPPSGRPRRPSRPDPPGATPSPGRDPGAGPRLGSAVPLERPLLRANAGPISWNMAMGATAADWRPAGPGRRRARESARRTKHARASWYESMGIMVVWEACNEPVGRRSVHSQARPDRPPDARLLPREQRQRRVVLARLERQELPTCRTNKVVIRNFKYNPGDFTASGRQRCIPTITSGRSVTFVNADSRPAPSGQGDLSLSTIFSPAAWYTKSIFHSITSCQSPCGLKPGSPIRSRMVRGSTRDSSGLRPPRWERLTWATPANLKPGYLHVLLPDPPVHARRLPDHQGVVGRARSAGSEARAPDCSSLLEVDGELVERFAQPADQLPHVAHLLAVGHDPEVEVAA